MIPNRFVGTLLALAVSVVSLNRAAATSRPNVLLITIDDLNDWTGCLGGHPQANTPQLDRLASLGVLFANAHCQAPICRPSRHSFLDGLRPTTSGHYGNSVRYDGKPIIARLPLSLPRRFSAAGYQTIGTGKLYHSGDAKHFDVHKAGGGQGPFPSSRINVPVEVKSKLWDWGRFPQTEVQAHDWQNAQWLIEQMQRPAEKPRWMAIGFYRPHVPLYAPPRWFDEAPDISNVRLPPILRTDWEDIPTMARVIKSTQGPAGPAYQWAIKKRDPRFRGLAQAYLASTSFMDHCLGLVVGGLEKSPLADNTWIVVLSDHGWHLGEKQHFAKQTLWERSTRVPLIIVPPRSQRNAYRSGVRCDRPVELLDVYPTLLDACELAAHPDDVQLEGLSLLPWMKDPQRPKTRPALTTIYRGNHSLRGDRYRYIRYSDGSEELYDLQEDPNEWHNLIGLIDERSELNAIRQRLAQHLPKNEANAKTPQP